MVPELGVLFFYHKDDAVTRNNLASFRRHNPAIHIELISSGEQLERENLKCQYDLSGEFKGWPKERIWPNADLQMYAWSRKRRTVCRRWLVAEWDMYCRGSLMEYIKYIKDFELSAPVVKYHLRDHDWHWWREIEKLPKEYASYAMGLSPLAGVVISDDVLGRVDRQLSAVPCDCFCEVRLATIANYLGFAAVANPMAGEGLSWQGVDAEQFGRSILVHAVKYLV